MMEAGNRRLQTEEDYTKAYGDGRSQGVPLEKMEVENRGLQTGKDYTNTCDSSRYQAVPL